MKTRLKKVRKSWIIIAFIIVAFLIAFGMYWVLGRKQQHSADTILDFSSKKLVVQLRNDKSLSKSEPVLSQWSKTYLLGYKTEKATEEAYYRLKPDSVFIDTDGSINIEKDGRIKTYVDDGEVLNNISKKSEIPDPNKVAIISTGATDDDLKLSVLGKYEASPIGDTLTDILSDTNSDVDISSIQAFDKNGNASSASVYAAILSAKNEGNGIIVLPFSTTNLTGTQAISQAVKEVTEVGVTVVGAAGDSDIEAMFTTVGADNDAIVVGACNKKGTRIKSSNYGQTVSYNVVAKNSREAAVIMGGYIASNGVYADGKTVFTTDGKADTGSHKNEIASMMNLSLDDISEGKSITFNPISTPEVDTTKISKSVLDSARTMALIGADASVKIPSSIDGKDFTISGSKTGSNEFGLEYNGQPSNGTGQVSITPTKIVRNGDNSSVTYNIQADTSNGIVEGNYTFHVIDGRKGKTSINVSINKSDNTGAVPSGDTTIKGTDSGKDSSINENTGNNAESENTSVNNNGNISEGGKATTPTNGNTTVNEGSSSTGNNGATTNNNDSTGSNTTVNNGGKNATEYIDNGDDSNDDKKEDNNATDLSKVNKESFESKRLLVKIEDDADKSLIVGDTDATVLGTDDDVYLLKYSTENEAIDSYKKYLANNVKVEPDALFAVADDSSITDIVNDEMNIENNPLNSDLQSTSKRSEGAIAVIDTGASSDPHIVESASMLDGDVGDDNGHGSFIIYTIVAQNPDARILSIKAFDKNGYASTSSVYAAIRYAINQNVSIINLSFSGKKTENNQIIEDIINEAVSDGITVIGAAGNNGDNAVNYIPSSVSGAIIIGSADEDGKPRSDSNTGTFVDFYVKSKSTSEGSAIATGIYSKNKELKVDNDLIFSGESETIVTSKTHDYVIKGVDKIPATWSVDEDTLTINGTTLKGFEKNADGGVFENRWLTSEDGPTEYIYDESKDELSSIKYPTKAQSEQIEKWVKENNVEENIAIVDKAIKDGEFNKRDNVDFSTAATIPPRSFSGWTTIAYSNNWDTFGFYTSYGYVLGNCANSTAAALEVGHGGTYYAYATTYDLARGYASYYVVFTPTGATDGVSRNENGLIGYQRSAGILVKTWPTYAHVSVTKKSDNSNYVYGDSFYSLAGAVFYVKDSRGNVVRTLTTDANGNTPTVDLDAGTYTVVEVSPPKGYKLNKASQSKALAAGADGIYTFSDTPYYHGKFIVFKVDQVTGSALTGAKFKLQQWSKGANKYVDFSGNEFTADFTGSTFISKRVYETDDNQGWFRVVETQLPGSHKNDPSWKYDASAGGYVQPNGQKLKYPDITETAITVSNPNTPVQVQFIKKCEVPSHGNERIEGATINLYPFSKSKGTFDMTKPKEMKWDATLKVYKCEFLPTAENTGRFKIFENKLPKGYKGSVNIEASISSLNTQTTPYTYTGYNHEGPTPARVSLVKQDSKDKSAIKGASFSVNEWDEFTKTWNKVGYLNWDDSQQKYVSDTLYGYYSSFIKTKDDYNYYGGHYNNGKFRIIEEKAPTGYVTPNPKYYWDVTFDRNTDLNQTLNLDLSKYTKTAPNVQKTLASDGQRVVNGRINVTTGQLTAENDRTTIYIYKQDADGNPINGITYLIGRKDEPYNQFIKYTTGKDTDQGDGYITVSTKDGKHALITPGEYVYKEVEGPESKGYKLDTKLYSFYVNEQGYVSETVNGTYKNYITIKRNNYAQYPIQITKSTNGTTGVIKNQDWDFATDFPLETRIAIYEYKGSGNVNSESSYKIESYAVLQYNTTANAFVDENTLQEVSLPYEPENGGHYMVKEIQQTPGYILDSTPKFITVPIKPDSNPNNRKISVTFDNKPNTFSILKTDMKNITQGKGKGNPIEGIKFSVYREGNEASRNIKSTDANGNVSWSNLPPGTWHYTEVDAPDGIALDPTVYTFIVDEDGKIHNDDFTTPTDKLNVALSDGKEVTLEILKEDSTYMYLNNFPEGTEFYLYEWNEEKQKYVKVTKIIYKSK